MAGRKDRTREYVQQTHDALLNSAENLFGTGGYAESSLDQICREARVTKGALYHHFGSKKGVFEAVFAVVCARLMEQVMVRLAEPASDAFSRGVAAIEVWLEAVITDATVRSILMQAPVVLGWSRWRELEQEHVGSVITDVLASLMETGAMQPLPVPELAAILNAAIVEGSMMIAHADDPAATKQSVDKVLAGLLEGIRIPAPPAERGEA